MLAYLPFRQSSKGIGDALVDKLASAIQNVEGYYAPGTVHGGTTYPNGSLAWQNNNPGNIRYVPNGYNYPGCTQGASGFCKYPDYATGQAALDHQIQVQINSGQNLTEFFNQYAPSSDNNNTNAYINTVASQAGIDATTPLSQIQAGYSVSNNSDGADSTNTDGSSEAGPGISDVFSGSTDGAGGSIIAGVDNSMLYVGGAIALLLFMIIKD